MAAAAASPAAPHADDHAAAIADYKAAFAALCGGAKDISVEVFKVRRACCRGLRVEEQASSRSTASATRQAQALRRSR